LSAPSTSSITSLTNATTVAPSFVPDVAGVYVASLIVNDGKLDSEVVATTITVETANTAPVANAGTAQTVTAGATATLSGTGSTDANGDRLTYKWTLTSVPTSSTAALLSLSTTSAPTLRTDVAGVYVLTLVVNDGRVDSSNVATVAVTAVSP
jgi:hypothetical protein